MEPYYYNSSGSLVYDSNNFEDWAVANVRLNLSTMNNWASDKKKKVATHEFGHALSLAHNFDDVSVMKSGDTTFNVPQTADKNHLIERWK